MELDYEGEWKDGIVNGQGTYTFRSGIKGVGEFRKDKPWNINEYDKNGNINHFFNQKIT